jgi:hypothetical protein
MTKRERLEKTAQAMRERNAGNLQEVRPPDTSLRPISGGPVVYETVQEIAKEWKVSEDTVRRIFGNRSDVLKIAKPFNPRRSRRVTLRIPVTTKNLVAHQMSQGNQGRS